MGEAKKAMFLKTKIKITRLKIQTKRKAKQFRRQSQKIALAVVVTQFLIAGICSYAVRSELFAPKIVHIQPSQAKTPTQVNYEPINDTTTELMAIIWRNESSNGKYNYSKCAAIGKVNGIGYGIYNGKYLCFNSHNDEMDILHDWIVDHKSQGMNDTELLCHYSGNNYKICK
jgi:hypothetical protein